jgi:hypothetical protein
MDIFTTQLTRVVPVPIKPASLKVKALLKDAANTKLNQDPDHLENHEYYFTKEEDQYHASQQEAQQDNKEESHGQQETIKEDSESIHDDLSALESGQHSAQHSVKQSVQQSTQLETSDEKTDPKNNKPKHLDLYV